MQTVVIDIHTVKGVRPDFDVYIGRRMWQDKDPRCRVTSKWHNPFKPGRDGTLEEIIVMYRAHVLARPDLLAAIPELVGKRLGCWCKNTHACHGDILAELANDYALESSE